MRALASSFSFVGSPGIFSANLLALKFRSEIRDDTEVGRVSVPACLTTFSLCTEGLPSRLSADFRSFLPFLKVLSSALVCQKHAIFTNFGKPFLPNINSPGPEMN
jgi:hypothetical protein